MRVFRQRQSIIAAVILTSLAFSSSAFAAVTVDGLTYSVVSSARASSYGSGGSAMRAAGEFIVLRLTVKNAGKNSAEITTGDIHLTAGEDEFELSSASPPDLFESELRPGASRTGTVVFDVPVNTAPSKYTLKVYGHLSGTSKTIHL